MVKPGWRYANDLLRPDKDHKTYQLIRLYLRDSSSTIKDLDDVTLNDELNLSDGDVLWISKGVDSWNPEFHNYFVVIHRGKSEELEGMETPYVKAERPWEAPPGLRGQAFMASTMAEINFLDMAVQVCFHEEAPVVVHCVGFQMSEYKKKADYLGPGMGSFQEGLNALVSEAEKSGQ